MIDLEEPMKLVDLYSIKEEKYMVLIFRRKLRTVFKNLLMILGIRGVAVNK